MFSKKFFLLLIIFSFVLLPAISIAAYGLEETADKAGLKQTGPEELPTLIGSVLGTGLSLVGVLFFALMLYGGLTWMLARGNSEQESKALDTITAAIIGIIIVLASYAITNFVFKSVGPGGGTSSGGGGDDNDKVEICSLVEDKLAEKCSVLSDKNTCDAALPAELCDWGTEGSCGGLVENGTDFCAGQTKAEVDGMTCGGYQFCE